MSIFMEEPKIYKINKIHQGIKIVMPVACNITYYSKYISKRIGLSKFNGLATMQLSKYYQP